MSLMSFHDYNNNSCLYLLKYYKQYMVISVVNHLICSSIYNNNTYFIVLVFGLDSIWCRIKKVHKIGICVP